eukprot:3750213-Amphidinium_carterae.1
MFEWRVSCAWYCMVELYPGECPVVDYGLAGRWMTGAMGVVGVGFFTIPFGLMSGGFEDSITWLATSAHASSHCYVMGLVVSARPRAEQILCQPSQGFKSVTLFFERHGTQAPGVTWPICWGMGWFTFSHITRFVLI